MLADTAIFGPIHVGGYFTHMTLCNGGSWGDAAEKLRRDFWPTCALLLLLLRCCLCRFRRCCRGFWPTCLLLLLSLPELFLLAPLPARMSCTASYSIAPAACCTIPPSACPAGTPARMRCRFSAELTVWPAIQVVNFKLVPAEYQLLVVNMFTIAGEGAVGLLTKGPAQPGG